MLLTGHEKQTILKPKVQIIEQREVIEMKFNYSKLKGRIIEIYGSQRNFAHAMGTSERTISLKLNGRIPFSQTEITKAISLLNLNLSQASEYFFVIKVQ